MRFRRNARCSRPFLLTKFFANFLWKASIHFGILPQILGGVLSPLVRRDSAGAVWQRPRSGKRDPENGERDATSTTRGAVMDDLQRRDLLIAGGALAGTALLQGHTHAQSART